MVLESVTMPSPDEVQRDTIEVTMASYEMRCVQIGPVAYSMVVRDNHSLHTCMGGRL
jgi:hypothetical protein